MSDDLAFEPEVIHAMQASIMKKLVGMLNDDERPVRRAAAALPSMPPSTRGAVASQLGAALSTLGNSRAGVAGICQELKAITSDVVSEDNLGQLPRRWRYPDAVIKFTGFDAWEKTSFLPKWDASQGFDGFYMKGGDYSKTDTALAWGSFALNFVPVTKIPKLAKWGKGLVTRPRPVPKPTPVARPPAPKPKPTASAKPLGPPRPTPRPIPPTRPDAVAGAGNLTHPAIRPGPLPGAAGAGAKALSYADAMKLAQNAVFTIPPGGTVLHSGLAIHGQSGMAWAKAMAQAAGGKSLEMTHVGARLTLKELGAVMPWREAVVVWNAASRRFVEQSSGRITALVGTPAQKLANGKMGPGLKPGSTFLQVEVPAAIANRKIPELVVQRYGDGVAAKVVSVNVSRSNPNAAATIRHLILTKHPHESVKIVFTP